MKNIKYGHISSFLEENINKIKNYAGGSADLVIREIIIDNVKTAVIAAEGMVNSFYFSSIITDNLCVPDYSGDESSSEIFNHLYNYRVISPDQKIFTTLDDLFVFIYSGFGVILIDGTEKGIAFGTQGFSFRSVNTPTTDANIKGSKEGFTEAIKINQTLIRRRIKAPELVFESIRLGNDSKTDCAIAYMSNYVSSKLLNKVKKILINGNLDMVLESGSIKMLLTTKPLSLFSEIGSTERPDTLAKKLYEGKIGILIDGTPFVLIIPFLFPEHFHSLDDFAFKAIYSNFIRFLKFSAFTISFLLPGLYVAVASFHPEVLPEIMQQKVTDAASSTPYSFLIEAVLIHFSYEIMREAGLRLPKEIGHAVSIVGGLIIGESAVSAGIISAPMVLVAALAVISAFVVPALMDSIVILRFLLILLGGILGLYGVSLGVILVCINIFAKTVFGIPYSSGISPVNFKTFSSFLYKSPRQQFASGKVPKVHDMPGAGAEDKIKLQEIIRYNRLTATAISVIVFSASGFSLWVFVQLVRTTAMPELSFGVILSAIIILLFLCDNCSTSGAARASGFFYVLFILGGIMTAFIFIFNGLTVEIILASSINMKYYLIFAFIEVLILTLLIPFFKPKGIKAIMCLTLQELICVLITLLVLNQSMITLLPFTIFFQSILIFLKLIYTVNLINDSMMTFYSTKIKIKPAICTALFLLGCLFFIVT